MVRFCVIPEYGGPVCSGLRAQTLQPETGAELHTNAPPAASCYSNGVQFINKNKVPRQTLAFPGVPDR